MDNLCLLSAPENELPVTFSKPSKNKKPSKKSAKPKKSSSVVLGYKDEIVDAETQTDAFFSKLGGAPDWPFTPHPVFNNTAVCTHCKENMFFILQLYAPLIDSPYDRTLYLFACPRPSCRGKSNSVQVIRALKYNSEYAKKLKTKSKPVPKKELKPTIALGELWDSKSGGFSFNTAPEVPSFADSFKKLTINPKVSAFKSDTPEDKNKNEVFLTKPSTAENILHIPWPENLDCFPAYYISTGPEELASNFDSADLWDMSCHSELIEKYANFELQNEHDENWAGEVYEKADKPNGVDKAFLNFSCKASQNPGQLLRYDLGGAPLLYSLTCPVADQLLGFPAANMKRSKLPVVLDHIPKCENCGSRRVFEFQLMPHLLTELNFESHISKSPNQCSTFLDYRNFLLESSGWEFGTVLVFTCEKDCSVLENSYMRELALIQTESNY